MPGGRIGAQPPLSPRNINGFGGVHEDGDDFKLKSRLEQSSAENLANNYFKNQGRSTNIMEKMRNDKNRTIGTWTVSRVVGSANGTTNFPSNRVTWDNLMNGVILTDDVYERPITGHNPTPNCNTSPTFVNGMRKPQRLEALGGNIRISSAKKSKKSKKAF